MSGGDIIWAALVFGVCIVIAANGFGSHIEDGLEELAEALRDIATSLDATDDDIGEGDA